MKTHIVRSNFRAIAAILRDWSIIITIIAINIKYDWWYLYLPSIWIIGAFQFALGEAIIHEAAHNNLFKQKRLNVYFEFLYALPFFLTVKQFSNNHFPHHKYTGQKQDQLSTDYENFGLYKPNQNLFLVWFVYPIVGVASFYYASQISLKPFWKEGFKIVLFWTVILILFIVTNNFVALCKFWLIPLFWSYYSYQYWSEISDHYRTKSGTRSNVNFLTNIITHNNGYHYLHHKFPAIPWYMLKKCHYILTPNEGDISNGFIDTYRQFLKNNSQKKE